MLTSGMSRKFSTAGIQSLRMSAFSSDSRGLAGSSSPASLPSSWRRMRRRRLAPADAVLQAEMSHSSVHSSVLLRDDLEHARSQVGRVREERPLTMYHRRAAGPRLLPRIVMMLRASCRPWRCVWSPQRVTAERSQVVIRTSVQSTRDSSRPDARRKKPCERLDRTPGLSYWANGGEAGASAPAG